MHHCLISYTNPYCLGGENMKLFILLGFLLIFAGCTPLRELRFDTIENSLKIRTAPLVTNSSEISHVEEFDNHLATNTTRIHFLEEEINKMYGVSDANVVILENAAIVSVDFNEDIREQDLARLKKSIEERVKNSDTSIKYVSVTSAPELMERLNEISLNLEQKTRERNKNNELIVG